MAESEVSKLQFASRPGPVSPSTHQADFALSTSEPQNWRHYNPHGSRNGTINHFEGHLALKVQFSDLDFSVFNLTSEVPRFRSLGYQ